MKLSKTPQEKKRLSYQRDHVVATYSKGGRKSWPCKEARIARTFRRQIKLAVAGFDHQLADEIESAVRAVVRPEVRKFGVQTLGESVTQDLQARERRHRSRQKVRTFYEERKIAFPSGLARPRKHFR